MGRRKREAVKRKELNKKRNIIRKKMGKKIFFTLTHCRKKLKGISNGYNYKSNMHNLCFVGASFFNVKYQASIITACNFRDACLKGVDFFNCNMKNAIFKNAVLDDVVFYNCNLKDANFEGASFKHVAFLSTNIEVAKQLNLDTIGISVLKTYPVIRISETTKVSLLNLSKNETIFASKVLHVNKVKLNNWALNLIELRCGEQGVDLLDKILHEKDKWDNLYTIYSYISIIEKKQQILYNK